LAIDADVAGIAAVDLDELLGLHDHAARAAEGVVDSAQSVARKLVGALETSLYSAASTVPRGLSAACQSVSV
jgi:hypothetical protein